MDIAMNFRKIGLLVGAILFLIKGGFSLEVAHIDEDQGDVLKRVEIEDFSDLRGSQHIFLANGFDWKTVSFLELMTAFFEDYSEYSESWGELVDLDGCFFELYEAGLFPCEVLPAFIPPNRLFERFILFKEGNSKKDWDSLILENDFVIAIGDIHASAHSLFRVLAHLKKAKVLDDNWILNSKYKMLFMGDYGDRGRYGIEVFMLIMLLKINNPDSVFLLRGNHESSSVSGSYGLTQEI